jgi:hypothetical protein
MLGEDQKSFAFTFFRPADVTVGIAEVARGHWFAVSAFAWARRAFDEHRIAELMRPVGVRAEGHGDLVQQQIVGKSPQELKMAFAGLMHTGQQCVDNVKRRFAANASTGNAVSGAHPPVRGCGGFERADHRRPDGDNAPARCFREGNR